MTARGLLRLYPRAWRDRYGEEIRGVVGDGAVSGQQAIDLIGGAIDAWMSPRLMAKMRRNAAGNGGQTMIQELKVKCANSTPRYTVRDGFISAGVLLAIDVVLSLAGIAAGRGGYRELGDALKSLAFPVALVLSMPFAVMKGQPRRVQTFVILVPLAILIAATYIATKI